MSKLRAAMVLLAVAAATAACHPDEPSGGKAPVGQAPAGGCRTEFLNPWRPVITSGRLIRGEAVSRCRQRPRSHTTTLTLERQSPAGWETKDTETSSQIPTVQGITLLVLVDCAPGNWRLRAQVKVAWPYGVVQSPGDTSDILKVRDRKDCEAPR